MTLCHITADNLNTQVLKTTLMVMLVKITLPVNPTNISAALENRSSFTANEYSYLSDCQSFKKWFGGPVSFPLVAAPVVPGAESSLGGWREGGREGGVIGPVVLSFLPCSLGKNSVTRSHLAARKAGKCTLALCPEERGNGFDEYLASLSLLSKEKCGSLDPSWER